MPLHTAERLLPHPSEAVYAWHGRPGAFQRLAPPWAPLEVLSQDPGLDVGVRLTFRGRLGPIPLRWEAEHTDHEAGRGFTDVQVRGPFRRWEHRHRFEPEGEGTQLVDAVQWSLPLGALGNLFGGWVVRRQLRAMFAFRHQRTADDLQRHALFNDQPRKTFLIGGATGFVGERLCAFLTTGGHTVRRLVRGAPKGPNDFRWDVDKGELDPAALEGVDAVIQLAGSPIATRWTPAAREQILQSRVRSTGLLVKAIAAMAKPPEVFVGTSAVGFYGPNAKDWVDESAPQGPGFAAEVCAAWEAAAAPVAAHTRLVIARIGLPIDAGGGVLAGLLPTARLGLGGPLGGGQQWMPWIAIDDLLGALQHAVFTPALVGPFNACAPEPVRQADFARTLGKVLGRPAFLPAPAAPVRLALGQMGEELLLGGQRARPQKLAETGFVWLEPDLERALRKTLGRG